MTGGTFAEASGYDADDTLLLTELSTEEPAQPDAIETPLPEPQGRAGWALPAVALVLALGWVAAMLWLAAPELRAGLTPLVLAQFIGALCVPLALIGVVYLLLLRTSSAEARRFGATARTMRAEAASLERTVAGLTQRIEENRLALSEQVALLTALGEGAAERLQAISNGMAHEVKTIDAAARTLGIASSDAEQRVQLILNLLPRAQDELRTLVGQVDTTGVAAAEQVAALDAQLAALAERGREADTVAGGAAQRLAAHIARMEATSETAGTRLEQVAGEMSSAVDAVLDRAAEAVDGARRGIAAQGEAMLAMLSANQAALDRAGRDSAETLAERMATIEGSVARISEQLAQEQARAELLLTSLHAGIARADADVAQLHERGVERTQALSASVSVLQESFAALGETLRQGDGTARSVIATSEALLVALDATAREMDESLPEALSRLESRVTGARQVVSGAKPELLALVTAAESTHDAIEAIADVVARQRDTLAESSATLLDTLEKGRAKTDAIEAVVDETIATARRFADEAAPQLVEAMLRVRDSATATADQARATLEGVVPDAAWAIEEASTAALRRAVDGSVRRQLAELADTTEKAVEVAARASERLAEQVLTIAETSASIEQRIEAAKAELEDSDRDHFARRVSLLIEALNSASIDIAKTFAHDVSDSAWAAYLKGDRGVFTRRAVRLLDPGEAREIARLYDEDAAFREQVNRYIHDFEAMLRQILALRDGSPLGVTLLSSDMGKLYVVLAQAIERLRN